uniref:Uncharacterized protein n=1 Tax=Triticum urartu TaxID=4572 RepID=A0A8R7R637_TRIUA
MKTRVWGSHTPATTSLVTLVKPVQVGMAIAAPTSSGPDKPVQFGTAKASPTSSGPNKPVQVGTAKASPISSGPNKPVPGDTAMTHMVGHVPTMMLVTSEPVQEAQHSQVGHTPTTNFLGFCKPMWATRQSSTILNYGAMKRRAWGDKA